MTKTTIHSATDTTTTATKPIAHRAVTLAQPGGPDRRRRVTATVTAIGAAAIVGLAAGWGLASSPSHAHVAPVAAATAAVAPPPASASAAPCNPGVGGVSELGAALETCFGHTAVSVPDDPYQSFFSTISAIAWP